MRSAKEKAQGINGTDLPDIKAMSERDLASAINGGHNAVEAGIHTARAHAWLALTGALKTGALLLEVECRFKKQWGTWLEKNCPKLKVSTAYRYKDLALKFSHVRKPEEIPNLRQAYIATGILPEAPLPPDKGVPDLNKVSVPTGTDFLTRVQTMHTFYRLEAERFDPSAVEPEVLQELEKEIEAIQAMLQEFLKRLEEGTPKDGSATSQQPSTEERK